MLNSFSYSLPEEIRKAVQAKLDDWLAEKKLVRIWAGDATVWTNTDEAKWLGWLDSVSVELEKVDEYRSFAEDAAKFESVVLLGMGGSSLCPEVLAETFDKKQFHILDSTVPAQIRSLEDRLDLEKTLFIVASKSGSTLEPNTFKQYFYERVSEKVGTGHAGRHFVAITDPGSKMQRIAEKDKFRKIFFGNPEIGGRFSALSPFGLAAGAAMGLHVEKFLNNALEMVSACKTDEPSANPGAVLGAILGVCQANGRDKLTIFTSPDIYDVGAWLEQLVAESTGKHGKSIIPIDLEEIEAPQNYSDDRIFFFLKLKGSNDDAFEEKLLRLKDAGFPLVEIGMESRMNLGQEFFRWEFATAVAGAIMNINPFDQPDVESAKTETRKLTEEHEETGEFPYEKPFFEAEGIMLFTSEPHGKTLDKNIGGERSVAGYLEAHLETVRKHDYFALLAYIDRNNRNQAVLQEIRASIFKRTKAATTVGFGPRFLHSTGQAYKGGANNGVFLQITSDDAEDFRVPGQKYSFGVVKTAQARGDFQVLLDRGRRALRIHLGSNVSEELFKIVRLI